MEQFYVHSKEIKKFQEEVYNKSQHLEWPNRSHEEWRRSDPSLIPFDMLERVSPEALEEEVLSTYYEFQNTIQEAIAQAAKKYGGVQFFPWSDPSISHTNTLDILKTLMMESVDKVDVWRMLQCRVGGVLYVSPGIQIDEPICCALHGRNTDHVLAPVIVVIVDDDASCSFGLEVTGDGFFSVGVYASVGTRARLHAHQYQNTSLDSFVINSLFSRVEERAEFTSTSGQLGGMMTVDRVHAAVHGSYSHVHLNGYYFPKEDQLVDLRTYQVHHAEDANSRCLYHGVGLDQSHSVYRGLIQVGTQAVETDAYLTNNNLLLSEEARMDSIPCLNIHTNEVRCSHGATLGTLDEENIYYLKTRGLSDADAKELLIDGFFHVVLDEKFESANKKAKAIIQERIRTAI